MADRNREQLKGFFKRGEIPTEEQFAHLIDSSYNVEDGVNGPLKIGGAGQGNGDKLLINFYTNAVDPDDPQWAIKLLDYGQEGFSINENNDHPRLFIKKGSGEIGVGTTNPRMSLQVETPSLHDAPAIGGYSTGTDNHNGWLYMHVVSKANAEHAIIWDDKRPLRFGVETNMGGDGETFRNLLKIQPEANRGTGIYFPDNIGGGGGYRAWIRYYARSGEATTLEIGTSDNTDDHIALMPSGNVGIGTNTPQAKFVINNGTVEYGLVTFPPRSSNSLIEMAKIKPYSLLGGYGSFYVSEFNHDVYMNTLLLRTSDFTELFESEGAKTIPIGTAVLLTKEGLIRPVKKGEIPIGVISVAPAIICNNATEWPAKYLKNEFGQTLTEEIEEDISTSDGKTERIKVQKPILNPKYDPNREYIPRDQRPEWHPVGLLGQLHLRKGQPVAPTWVKIKDVSENVELWLVK
jgi:hypothetical protein